MAEEFYSLVTDYGAEKQLRCITEGLPFEVTHIALGDGNGRYYEPSTTQTKLVHEVWRGNVEKCEWTEERFYCVTTVPAEIGGFEVREAGVFDAENNLLVVSKFPETTKQAPESGTVKQLTIRIELEKIDMIQQHKRRGNIAFIGDHIADLNGVFKSVGGHFSAQR